MDRVMTVEEKIKRAEEIYARRHEQDVRSTATVHLHGKEKKDIKLFKKMILQMIVCLLIYLIFYTIQNNNYIFSEDFIEKSKEVLSYDTNFGELYDNVKNGIVNLFNNTEEASKNDENIGGSSEAGNKDGGDTEANLQAVSGLTEEEQQISQIKNITSFIKPVEGTISSRYGIRNPTTSTVPINHTGTDIAANLGTKIIAATDGEVVLASSEGDYGNHLKIKIGDVTTVYAHCNKLYVNEGDKVIQGQEIAEVGSTGNSTGPHLHFEIRLNDKTIDPEKILEL